MKEKKKRQMKKKNKQFLDNESENVKYKLINSIVYYFILFNSFKWSFVNMNL